MSSSKIVPLKPFILFMYGFPGAGKTAFARQLAEELNMAHLQQDRLAQELYGDVKGAADKLTMDAMHFMAREFLRAGVAVIFDSNIPRIAQRKALRETAKQAKVIPVMIWLQIDPETAFMRGQKRDRRKSDDHFAQPYTTESYEAFLNKMQNPQDEDYIVISGKHTFQTQRSAVYRRFYELGILNPAQLSQNIAKPELVNLVPQTNLGGRPEIMRRNINIR
jgi:predicted kinase